MRQHDVTYQRKKVACRKEFGAKVHEIVNRLSWKFMKIVILANMLAWIVVRNNPIHALRYE